MPGRPWGLLREGKRTRADRLAAGERPWPHGNKDLVPASEQRISIYVVRNLPLASLTRGWVGFHKHSIFEPGEPQSANACGFLLWWLSAAPLLVRQTARVLKLGYGLS